MDLTTLAKQRQEIDHVLLWTQCHLAAIAPALQSHLNAQAQAQLAFFEPQPLTGFGHLQSVVVPSQTDHHENYPFLILPPSQLSVAMDFAYDLSPQVCEWMNRRPDDVHREPCRLIFRNNRTRKGKWIDLNGTGRAYGRRQRRRRGDAPVADAPEQLPLPPVLPPDTLLVLQNPGRQRFCHHYYSDTFKRRAEGWGTFVHTYIALFLDKTRPPLPDPNTSPTLVYEPHDRTYFPPYTVDQCEEAMKNIYDTYFSSEDTCPLPSFELPPRFLSHCLLGGYRRVLNMRVMVSVHISTEHDWVEELCRMYGWGDRINAKLVQMWKKTGQPTTINTLLQKRQHMFRKTLQALELPDSDLVVLQNCLWQFGSLQLDDNPIQPHTNTYCFPTDCLLNTPETPTYHRRHQAPPLICPLEWWVFTLARLWQEPWTRVRDTIIGPARLLVRERQQNTQTLDLLFGRKQFIEDQVYMCQNTLECSPPNVEELHATHTAHPEWSIHPVLSQSVEHVSKSPLELLALWPILNEQMPPPVRRQPRLHDFSDEDE